MSEKTVFQAVTRVRFNGSLFLPGVIVRGLTAEDASSLPEGSVIEVAPQPAQKNGQSEAKAKAEAEAAAKAKAEADKAEAEAAAKAKAEADAAAKAASKTKGKQG